MPVQSFAEWEGTTCPPGGIRCRQPGPAAGRALVLVLTIIVSSYALYEMLGIVGFGDATAIQLLLVSLFLATFTWMAQGAASAVLGFVRVMLSREGHAPVLAPETAGGQTVVVMPVYNEAPGETFTALARMGEEIAGRPWRRRVDLFVLSDTTDPAAGMEEFHHAGMLAQRFSGRVRVYYRRRKENSGRKAGNIADFIRRWGGHYDYMIVLDADSYLTGDAIGGLIAAMDRDPRAGLIQAPIRLAGCDSLFARLQQFSAAVFGPVANAGTSYWHGRDGNFNGHNAILRVSAFAAACGLPDLPGGKPFGGHVLSHDFVEAALLRRAGWDVYTALDIDGTYEESPPNLIEYFKRDRRWMQGNLQHARILSADGLHWMSRLHLVFGIMAYLSPVLWMLFLAVGISIAVYTTFVPQEYFPDTHSLFPTWPIFDAERAYFLTGFVLVVVLLPKLLGYASALLHRRKRRAAGGVLPLTVSAVLEIIAAALLAPLHMIVQTIHLVEILSGQDSGWPAQNRREPSIPFPRAARFFLVPTLIGLLVAAGSWAVSLSLFLWLSPIWAGLVLAIPMAMITGSRANGRIMREAGLFLIEEEGLEAFDRTPEARPSAPAGALRPRGS